MVKFRYDLLSGGLELPFLGPNRSDWRHNPLIAPPEGRQVAKLNYAAAKHSDIFD
jgi:hypothetical protein